MKQILSGILCLIFLFGTGAFVYGYRNSNDSISLNQSSAKINSAEEQYSIVKMKEKVSITAPVLSQFPELERGCEVTSLAMLLQSAGVNVDKLTLAKQIKKDPTPRKIQNGRIHFGDPNAGFVGNIYSYTKPGFGVYNKPIFDLGNQYLPGKMINLTGRRFEDLRIYLSDGRPVWVIINTEYRELPNSYFQTWYTKKGTIRVTLKEHSVLVTGYDQTAIYFNDPLTGQKNKAPINAFKKAWVQMGSQAITYQK
jgi:uncharacterized protein YvpB